MKTEEIENGNKLIAEFMGGKIKEFIRGQATDSRWTEYLYSPIPNEIPEHEETEAIHSDTLLYHLSWAWLMPVVERIESDDEFSVEIIDHVCDIKKFSKIAEGHQTFIKKLGNNKIEATWICIVELLKCLKNEDAQLTNLTERGE